MSYLYYALPVFIFANVTAFTPGPNNIILSTTGVNHGFGKTIPQIMGVFFGYLTILSISLLGLGQIFLLYPILSSLMKVLASLFLFYLSYKIFFSSKFSNNIKSKPLNFFQMYFFQVINPKGVMVSISASSLFLRNEFSFQIEFLIIFLCFTFSTISSGITWALIGHYFRKFTSDEKKILFFNRFMSIALFCCVIMIII